MAHCTHSELGPLTSIINHGNWLCIGSYPGQSVGETSQLRFSLLRSLWPVSSWHKLTSTAAFKVSWLLLSWFFPYSSSSFLVPSSFFWTLLFQCFPLTHKATFSYFSLLYKWTLKKVYAQEVYKKYLSGFPLGTFKESEERDWVISPEGTTYFL